LKLKRRLAAIFAADVVGFSRLMGEDEVGTLERLKALRLELVQPAIDEYKGRTVKLMGDGILAEFPSVVEAVKCAVYIQKSIQLREIDLPDEQRIKMRIGINLGDILVEGSDIFGDGVNVAARLEGLAEPGGICISGVVYEQARNRLDLIFFDRGEQKLKNIAHPIHVYAISVESDKPLTSAIDNGTRLEQEIRYCTAPDGVRIAYATVGSGPTLVKAANWLNHLEFDWESPIWSNLLRELASNHSLVRYDERGNGLSDWDTDEFSLDAFVRDLETVVDELGLDRFPLFGVSQGCSVSIAYAAKHPEKVSCLILYGGYAIGAKKRQSGNESEQEFALIELVRVGWGKDNPAFRQVFTSLFIPEGTSKQMQWLNDLQRNTISPENAVRHLEATGQIDVSSLLSKLKVPTLVLHCRGDAIVPFEQGQYLAKSIPGARFVPLEGNNHLMLGHEPGWPKFLAEVRKFLTHVDSSTQL
jgi:class 3 adenylate cyclase/pimeloyl-ACP methyl ester carboxylesterase